MGVGDGESSDPLGATEGAEPYGVHRGGRPARPVGGRGEELPAQLAREEPVEAGRVPLAQPPLEHRDAGWW